ncbi:MULTISPECIES: recombinase family protein [Clostridia]|uniref:Site-specific DNA recombinase n=3 Tax=Clostridia TaxID=186801 RepID=A0A1I0D742_9FIRM|nr:MULTISPECIES: recombinase family protein [Clostridia]MDY3230126.1 recombinase family protein [Clostridiaceae bacterium]MCF2702008.1 recombinase family protein [Enterocloster clostridioformis]MSS36195.1 recombinase family protein [Clostridium porci]MSS89509.1 recombinase family protein [Eisenbergiella porci]SET27731.1 Site-specific DNA recombinase [Enterocloster clostridioformis]
MARKSRKAQAQPVAEVKKEAAALPTAIYARLSVENSGKDDDGNSLQNQIAVCEDYLDGCPHLRLTEVYSDNGRTGTVFDRPAWNRLMDDVRTGKIQCIVVRDLSRFGRDYVETGSYLEKIFPALGTRFISVKENFDNFTCGNAMESLSVSLQNLVNAMYSRDISKKVSTALRAQMETGRFRNRNLPYGYLWNGDKTAYVVDEEAAAVVRQIFEWKRQEVSVYTIVERLKAGDIESPERHKRRAGTRNGDNIQGEGWCPSTIRGILQNRAYIGEMICGKSETALYKGLKKHVTETDKWIVVPDAHPPIVSISDFEAVERQMREDSAHRETAMEWSADIRAGMIDLFAGKIFCADCGKRMYYKRQRIQCKGVVFRGVYDCSTHLRRGHGTCFKHAMRQDALNEKVFNAIRDQLQVALDYEKLLLAMRGGSGEASVREKHKAAVASVKLRLNALKKKRAGLYESYVEGILNEEEYAFAKQTYEEQYEALNRLLDEAVERRERFLASISPDNKWLTMMRGAAGMTGLTQELVDAIIEKVLVYGGGRIEVVFNYNDVFYAMLECVEQIKEAGGDD